MAGGFTRDGAVQEQIDASIADAVTRARRGLATGKPSRTHCVECEVEIPEARCAALPGVQRCVSCQEAQDAEQKRFELFNRRGSKDSQLR